MSDAVGAGKRGVARLDARATRDAIGTTEIRRRDMEKTVEAMECSRAGVPDRRPRAFEPRRPRRMLPRPWRAPHEGRPRSARAFAGARRGGCRRVTNLARGLYLSALPLPPRRTRPRLPRRREPLRARRPPVADRLAPFTSLERSLSLLARPRPRRASCSARASKVDFAHER